MALKKADLLRAVVAQGGTVEDASTSKQYSFRVDAPHGKVWRSDGFHSLEVWCYKGGPPSWLSEVVADALERISQGTEDCPGRGECDWCDAEQGVQPLFDE